MKNVNIISSVLTSGFRYVVIEMMKSRNTRPVKIPNELMMTSRNKSLTVLFDANASTCIGIFLFFTNES